MAQEFKKGDVVRLKSGGPKMTVHGYAQIQPFDDEAYDDVNRVVVTFFVNDKLSRETFGVDSLEVV